MMLIDSSMRAPANTLSRWEIGSDFPRIEFPQSSAIRFPKQSVYYALGRHCVVGLLDLLPQSPQRRLWIPSFFCHDVAKYWSQWFEVKFYSDDPRWPEPDWKTILPSAHDIVIAMNYFSSRHARPWNTWHRNVKCLLVEDHTHDPVSEWALNSEADYVFSSLRKTLPVPDGAVLWSPRMHPLPRARRPLGGTIVKQRLSAMLLKKQYLQGKGSTILKQRYRTLFGRTAASLETTRPSSISPFSRRYLAGGIPKEWRRRRNQNAHALIQHLKGWRVATPLVTAGPAGSASFAVVLVFRKSQDRDAYRSFLISKNVYCPVHWPCKKREFPGSRDLSSRIITIPADQRYTPEDMRKVAHILKSEYPGFSHL